MLDQHLGGVSQILFPSLKDNISSLKPLPNLLLCLAISPGLADFIS